MSQKLLTSMTYQSQICRKHCGHDSLALDTWLLFFRDCDNARASRTCGAAGDSQPSLCYMCSSLHVCEGGAKEVQGSSSQEEENLLG